MSRSAVLLRMSDSKLARPMTLSIPLTNVDIPSLTIFQLTEELQGMNDWYSLGVALRVHPNKLKEIQKSSPHEGIQRWRIDLLHYWLNSTPDASWNDIIVALEKIGHKALSANLREKYQVSKITGMV